MWNWSWMQDIEAWTQNGSRSDALSGKSSQTLFVIFFLCRLWRWKKYYLQFFNARIIDDQPPHSWHVGLLWGITEIHHQQKPGETLRPEMSCVWVALLDSAFSERRCPKRCPKPRAGLCTPWCWGFEATNSPWLRSHPLETAHHYSTFANHKTHHFIQNVQKLLAAPLL